MPDGQDSRQKLSMVTQLVSTMATVHAGTLHRGKSCQSRAAPTSAHYVQQRRDRRHVHGVLPQPQTVCKHKPRRSSARSQSATHRQ